ncbi:MAG: hypothetical protein QM752_04095 [Gammaproteobacteria bacterium]
MTHQKLAETLTPATPKLEPKKADPVVEKTPQNSYTPRTFEQKLQTIQKVKVLLEKDLASPDLKPAQKQKLQNIQKRLHQYEAELTHQQTFKPAPTPKPGNKRKKTDEEKYQAKQNKADEQLTEVERIRRSNEEKAAPILYSVNTATMQHQKQQQSGRIVPNFNRNVHDRPTDMHNAVQTPFQLAAAPTPNMTPRYIPKWLKDQLEGRQYQSRRAFTA